MFRKVLKYDLMAVGRYFWLIAVAIAGISVPGALALRYLIDGGTESMILIPIFCSIFLAICYVALVGAAILTEILVYLRFYKNFYTDEGYLTFTLPVKRRTLLLAKTVNALIWSGALFLLYLFCAIVFMMLAPPSENGLINPVAFTWVGEHLSLLWNAIGPWIFVYVAEILAILVAWAFFSTALIQFSITMGAMIVKRAKLLLGIGIYYVIFSAFNGLSETVLYLFALFMTDGAILLLQGSNVTTICAVIALALLAVTVFLSGLSLILYFMTQDKLERKLNLT